ncbi:F-box domain/F-box-like [Leishmania donovani]|uniref:F-box_domain/F-box-like_putative/Pfam:PF00646/Pfa m:PF12937 n=2 Tax=Leishmania donovani TaxID=5661 RepID=A0A6J8FAV0_LEIDO|nr:F-box domain/F-box-like [Leishmania donovani]VDZ44544.1 F-box_domain/F-box-like_putative/Pfam:PF00646/Pfam:PF12937 [Leishmania donovani]
MFALHTHAVLSSSFPSSLVSDGEAVANDDHSGACVMKRGVSHVERLPRELLLNVFIDVIRNDGDNFGWIGVLSCVCRSWYQLCQHPVLWEYVAKRICVVYPLVVRLHGAAPYDALSQEIVNRMRLLESEEQCILQYDPLEPLPAPSRAALRKTMEKVRRYRESQQYYKYVQRRRRVVLHFFLSVTLFSVALAITTAMCVSEGFDMGGLCNTTIVFGLLWMAYLCIVAIIVSNVVMQAHFEPLPLLLRLRRNKLLIFASAVTILLGICDVIIPTLLIQINLGRKERFSWLWCGITVILSFCLWQLYTLMYIMPAARQQLRYQMTHVNVREGFQFVVLNIPNGFPFLFAAASFCALQYVQYGYRIYILLGGVPVIVSLGVLALVFLLDFYSLHRFKDLAMGICFFLAMLFPISLLVWEFRGLCLLPLAAAAFGIFFAHARYVVSSAIHELMRTIRAERNGCILRTPDANKKN